LRIFRASMACVGRSANADCFRRGIVTSNNVDEIPTQAELVLRRLRTRWRFGLRRASARPSGCTARGHRTQLLAIRPAYACSGQSFWPRTHQRCGQSLARFWFLEPRLTLARHDTTERLRLEFSADSQRVSTTSPSRIRSRRSAAFMDVTNPPAWRDSLKAVTRNRLAGAGSIRFARAF